MKKRQLKQVLSGKVTSQELLCTGSPYISQTSISLYGNTHIVIDKNRKICKLVTFVTMSVSREYILCYEKDIDFQYFHTCTVYCNKQLFIPFKARAQSQHLFSGNAQFMYPGYQISKFAHDISQFYGPQNTLECQNETTTHKTVLPVSQNLTKSHLEYNH